MTGNSGGNNSDDKSAGGQQDFSQSVESIKATQQQVGPSQGAATGYQSVK